MMKKIFYTLTAFLFFNISVFAQSQYVFIDFKDARRPGIQNEYPYPEKTVSNAIEDKLKKLGYKSKDSKGYTIYKGVMLPELGNQPYDLYFKIDRKSKKDKDVAVVNMLVSLGNEIFISDSSDSRVISNAKTFLDNLIPSIAAYDLQQQISNQQDAVSKAEKKYKSLQNNADDLQKKKKRIEQDIEDNTKDQKNQQNEIDTQKQLLEGLRAKQK